MKRVLYLAYYFRKMNWPLLRRFMAHQKANGGPGYAGQAVGFIRDSLRYNISPLEWYQFGFSGFSAEEKAAWAGTGTMYEYHSRMNPPEKRGVLQDKRRFYEAYRQFFRHEIVTLDEISKDRAVAERMLAAHKELVFKPADGNCGAGIAFRESSELNAETLAGWMREGQYDLMEERVAQHPALDALSPAGVNTVRIFTRLNEQDQCVVLGCRLRITVNSRVDNLAAGNLAAPVDEETGRVSGPAVYSDITKAPEARHPVTGAAIEGFEIPFWKEALALAREASEKDTRNRSIGWDIVITPEGPGLIEGNHDWCKLVWQLPARRGLKHMIEEAA